jgi:hypothetical protein
VDAAALAPHAERIYPDGTRETLNAQGGRYRLQLEGAQCLSEDCLMGGTPVILVEQAAVDLDAPQTFLSRTLSLAEAANPLPTPTLHAAPQQPTRWVLAAGLVAFMLGLVVTLREK